MAQSLMGSNCRIRLNPTDPISTTSNGVQDSAATKDPCRSALIRINNTNAVQPTPITYLYNLIHLLTHRFMPIPMKIMV